MKREDLWVLLGEAPTEMIEEASTAPTGKKVLWLRRVLPLAAAVVLLSATALAAGKYFGWQQVLETKPEELTESTEPLGVTVNAEDITFTVTEALADERVLYLLWEMQAPAAIFDERSTADGWLDFGEASVDTGGGYIFSAERPKEKSNILCGYLVADWNDAMRGSAAHLRVSGLGHLERTGDTFIAKVDMKALCDSAVRKGVDLDEWILNYPQMIGDGEGGYEVRNTDGEVVETIDMAYYEDGRLYVFSRYREDRYEPDSPHFGVLCDSTGERVDNVGGHDGSYYSVYYYDVAEEELPNLQYIQPGRWQRVPDYDAEWEVNFDIPQTVESVTLRDDEQVKITCSPITMAITLKDVYEAKGYEWEIETATGTQTAYENQRQEGGQVVRVLQLHKPVKPQEVTAVRKEGIDYLHQTDFSTHTLHIQSWLDREVYILPVENGKMSRGVIGVSNDDYTLFEAPAGTAAVAMRDGVVEQTPPEYKERWIGHMGRQPVLIRHEDGSAILYGHLKNVTLKPGDTVKQGEKLGECSDSGDTWVAGVGIVRYEVKNQFGGTAFPTYDRTWTFEEIFADSCQKPVEDAGKITWENSDLEDFCSFTFRLGQKNVNITAMKAGKVIASKSTGTNKGLGRVVAVEHEDGTYALYGYCSKIIAKVGDVVQAGDILAVSGRTGLASGENDSLAVVLIDDKDGLEYWIGGGFA